jgi:NitT/TauT family transport system permease protein
LSVPAEVTRESAPTTSTLATAVAKKAARNRWKARGYSLLGALTLLGLWWLASLYKPTEFELIPGPYEVAQRMWGFAVGDAARGVEPGWVFLNFWATFRKTLYGFVGAVVLGVPIGILMGRFRYWKAFFFDLIYITANVPLVVYAILALILFGLGDTGPAVVVAFMVLPSITLNVAAGVEGVDRGLLLMSQSYDRSTRQALQHIVFPTFYPFLFAAIRNSFASSWKLAALTETFAGITGVGVQIGVAFKGFATADMIAWMLYFGVFVVAIERLGLMPLERWVFRYRLKRGEDVLRF